MKSGNLNFLKLSGPLQACNGTALRYHRQNSHMPNTALKNYSSRLFSSIKSQSRYKTRFHVSFSSSFSTGLFQCMTVAMSYRDATIRAASQTLTHTLTCTYRVENVYNAEVNYEHTVSRDIHHIYIVSLPQQKVTPCCYLPTQCTFPLYLLDIGQDLPQIIYE